ncbi:MAG: response regulator, partial [Acidobacteria bacterium]
RNARAQASLAEDVLDVSRIISGKLRLAMRRVDLVDSVRAALDAVRPAAQAKGIDIDAVVGSDMLLMGDPDRLQQVCWNLLSNAVKFTPDGGRVEVRVLRTDSQLEMRVRDTGPGIAPEFLPQLFERFRQADSSTTRQHRGLGLGLAIVRHLVELHGGRVSAESAGPGSGATFVVRLPVSPVGLTVEEEPAGPDRPAAVGAARREAPRLTGIRVLVVDDEADVRDLLEQVLGRFGAEVRTVGSAQAALDAVQQWRPDVMLGDIGMPNEDGYTLIRRVRTLPPEKGGLTPAAALTAYGGEENRMRALAAGYQLHLAKPILPHELAEAVSGLALSTRAR